MTHWYMRHDSRIYGTWLMTPWYVGHDDPKNKTVRAGWPTPWAEFAVISAQLWSTIKAIFPWVALSWKKCSLFQIIVNYCQLQKRYTIGIWVQLLWECSQFELQHQFLVPKNCTILVCFHPLHGCQLKSKYLHTSNSPEWWGVWNQKIGGGSSKSVWQFVSSFVVLL